MTRRRRDGYRAHALRRLKERYGDGRDVLIALRGKVRRRECRPVRKESNTRRIFDVDHNGTTYRVVYSSSTQEIITVLYGAEEANRRRALVRITDAEIITGRIEYMIPEWRPDHVMTTTLDDLPQNVAMWIILGARELRSSANLAAESPDELGLGKWGTVHE